jgi:hypothetical protein
MAVSGNGVRNLHSIICKRAEKIRKQEEEDKQPAKD